MWEFAEFCLFRIVLNWINLDFGLLIRQSRTFEKAALGSGYYGHLAIFQELISESCNARLYKEMYACI